MQIWQQLTLPFEPDTLEENPTIERTHNGSTLYIRF
jgi:hypothetical protein